MTRTSISVDKTTKNRLDDLRPDGASWNEFMAEVADVYEAAGDGDDADTDEFESRLDDVEDRVARVEELVDRTPERTADLLERRIR